MVLDGFSNLNNSITHLINHSKLISKYVQRYTMNFEGLKVISDELNSTLPKTSSSPTHTRGLDAHLKSGEFWTLLVSHPHLTKAIGLLPAFHQP